MLTCVNSFCRPAVERHIMLVAIQPSLADPDTPVDDALVNARFNCQAGHEFHFAATDLRMLAELFRRGACVA